MKLTPLTPEGRSGKLAPEGRSGNTRRRWSVTAAVLLHLTVIAYLSRPSHSLPPGGQAAPSFDLVFEGPPQSPSDSAPPPRADIPAPDDAPVGAPAPSPTVPPVPDPSGTARLETSQGAPPAEPPPPAPATAAAPTPTPAPAPVPTRTPPSRPATAQLAETATAPPPPPASVPSADPAAAPTPAPVEVLPDPATRTATQTAPPAVRLQAPEDAPSEQAEQAPIMPQPPPPLPPEPSSPPRPRTASRAPSARAPAGSFANPMDLSLAPTGPAPARRGGTALSRGIDLTVPMAARGPSRSDPYATMRAANASADWNRGLLQYWLQHRYYPQQAAQNGDEGAVTIELTVERSGLVDSVRVLSTSGSQWLDMAAVGAFRGGHLPPFTEEMRQDKITFSVPINYYLIRR